jgi:hypothetical protein
MHYERGLSFVECDGENVGDFNDLKGLSPLSNAQI